jgi:glutamyl-tRNA synthetase
MINTPPQILIYQAFGAKVPEFAHLPMMLGPDGQKLSKRHGAVSVTEYRDRGFSPDAVIDYLSRFGWSPGEHDVRLSRASLIAAFDWAQCGRGDGRFDPKKFLAINFDHLKSAQLTPDAEYLRMVEPFLRVPGDVERALPAIRDRAQTFVQAAEMLEPLFRDPPVIDPAAAKLLTEESTARLRSLGEAIATSDWTEPALEAATAAWLTAQGLELKAIGQPLRVALTGRTASPGLYQVMTILGRDRTLARLRG